MTTLANASEAALRRALSAKRRARTAAAKAKRPVSVKADRGRVREPLYLAFIRRQPCVATGKGLGECSGGIQACHVRYSDARHGRRNPGMGVKPSDRLTYPACAAHHLTGKHAQHNIGEAKFWQAVGWEPAILMRLLSDCYDTGCDGAAIILGNHAT